MAVIGAMMLRPLFWFRRDPVGVELWSAMAALYWAAVLFHPFETFGISRSYSLLSAFASENAWAWWMLFVGLLQSAALCGGQYYLRYPGALVSMITWFFCAGLFFGASPYSHAPGMCALLGFGQLWVILRGPQE